MPSDGASSMQKYLRDNLSRLGTYDAPEDEMYAEFARRETTEKPKGKPINVSNIMPGYILTDINRRFPEIHTRARAIGDEKTSLRVSLFGEHADEDELDSLLSRAEADLRARLGLEITRETGDTTQTAE